MEKEIISQMCDLYNKLDDIAWDISKAKTDLYNLEEKLEKKIENSNSIKDIENLKRELRRDGLYSEKIDEFLENYMKYYNK